MKSGHGMASPGQVAGSLGVSLMVTPSVKTSESDGDPKLRVTCKVAPLAAVPAKIGSLKWVSVPSKKGVPALKLKGGGSAPTKFKPLCPPLVAASSQWIVLVPTP